MGNILRKYLQTRSAAAPSEIFSSLFITDDPETRDSITEALKYAPTELPIVTLGPSGSGKTSLARILHDHSGRSGEKNQFQFCG